VRKSISSRRFKNKLIKGEEKRETDESEKGGGGRKARKLQTRSLAKWVLPRKPDLDQRLPSFMGEIQKTETW